MPNDHDGLIEQLLEAQHTVSQYACIILKLEAALTEIEELSEDSPSSFRDFGDIARNARKAVEIDFHATAQPNQKPTAEIATPTKDDMGKAGGVI